jgi:hypothetical protein
MPYSPLKVNWNFGGTCHIHLRCWRIRQARNQLEAAVLLPASCWIIDWLILRPWMNVTCSSQTLIDFQQTPQRFIPEIELFRKCRPTQNIADWTHVYLNSQEHIVKPWTSCCTPCVHVRACVRERTRACMLVNLSLQCIILIGAVDEEKVELDCVFSTPVLDLILCCLTWSSCLAVYWFRLPLLNLPTIKSYLMSILELVTLDVVQLTCVSSSFLTVWFSGWLSLNLFSLFEPHCHQLEWNENHVISK